MKASKPIPLSFYIEKHLERQIFAIVKESILNKLRHYVFGSVFDESLYSMHEDIVHEIYGVGLAQEKQVSLDVDRIIKELSVTL